MKFDEYIPWAIRTENVNAMSIRQRMLDDNVIRMLHAVIGMTTEIGELTEAIHKLDSHRNEAEWANFREEVGDVFWYVAVMYDAAVAKFGQIAVRIPTWDHSWANGDCLETSKQISLEGALASTVGALANLIKRHIFYGDELVVDALLMRLHNVYKTLRLCLDFYYSGASCTYYNTLADNIEKLRKRHGKKFDDVGVVDWNVERELSHMFGHRQ
jgi:hypothetical protein